MSLIEHAGKLFKSKSPVDQIVGLVQRDAILDAKRREVELEEDVAKGELALAGAVPLLEDGPVDLDRAREKAKAKIKPLEEARYQLSMINMAQAAARAQIDKKRLQLLASAKREAEDRVAEIHQIRLQMFLMAGALQHVAARLYGAASDRDHGINLIHHSWRDVKLDAAIQNGPLRQELHQLADRLIRLDVPPNAVERLTHRNSSTAGLPAVLDDSSREEMRAFFDRIEELISPVLPSMKPAQLELSAEDLDRAGVLITEEEASRARNYDEEKPLIVDPEARAKLKAMAGKPQVYIKYRQPFSDATVDTTDVVIGGKSQSDITSLGQG